MLPVLLLGLFVILLSSVGATVISRFGTRIGELERNAAAVEQSFVRDDESISDLYRITEALDGRLFAHECKPLAAAHSKPVARKSVAKKAAPVKKAAAKKAPVRAR